jgi:hydroxyethylthiazole kinase-like uncharacterized protein yjeF
MWIATSDQSRAIDRRASDEFGIPAMVLMERAGLAIFQAVRELLPNGGSITVLCGRGNNGADGFVVARLARDHDYQVECLVAATEENLGLDAAHQCKTSMVHGVQPIFSNDARWTRKLEALGSRDLIVDALLGTGSRCELKEPILTAVRAINRSGVPVVAVDVPSGIDCDTGEELGDSVWALRTITLGLPKPYLFQGTGLDHAGYWTVDEIGFPSSLLSEPTEAKLINQPWAGHLLPERMKNAHKGDSGGVLIVAGSDQFRGAAVLATRGALRAGAGLVTVAGIRSVCDAVAAQCPEAILLPLPEQDGQIAPAAAEILLDHRKVRAAVFGPGLGSGEGIQEFLRILWSKWTLPCVVDADALNVASLGIRLPETECVLTPHPGELSRLLKLSIAEIQANRFCAMRQAVEQTHQCVLLKGPYSLVGTPGQPVLVNSTGNPGMATGGMGDVLSGIIGTLLAQDLPAYYAAGLGMYWHGAAGDHCAKQIGPIGYSVSDLTDALPAVRTKISQSCCA